MNTIGHSSLEIGKFLLSVSGKKCNFADVKKKNEVDYEKEFAYIDYGGMFASVDIRTV